MLLKEVLSSRLQSILWIVLTVTSVFLNSDIDGGDVAIHSDLNGIEV